MANGAVKQERGQSSTGGASWNSGYTYPPGHNSVTYSRVAGTSGSNGDEDEPPVPPSAGSMLPVDRLLWHFTWADLIEALWRWLSDSLPGRALLVNTLPKSHYKKAGPLPFHETKYAIHAGGGRGLQPGLLTHLHALLHNSPGMANLFGPHQLIARMQQDFPQAVGELWLIINAAYRHGISWDVINRVFLHLLTALRDIRKLNVQDAEDDDVPYVPGAEPRPPHGPWDRDEPPDQGGTGGGPRGGSSRGRPRSRSRERNRSVSRSRERDRDHSPPGRGRPTGAVPGAGASPERRPSAARPRFWFVAACVVFVVGVVACGVFGAMARALGLAIRDGVQSRSNWGKARPISVCVRKRHVRKQLQRSTHIRVSHRLS